MSYSSVQRQCPFVKGNAQGKTSLQTEEAVKQYQVKMILLFGQMSSRLTMSSMKVLNLVSWKIRNMGLRNSESALDLINIIS